MQTSPMDHQSKPDQNSRGEERREEDPNQSDPHSLQASHPQDHVQSCGGQGVSTVHHSTAQMGANGTGESQSGRTDSRTLQHQQHRSARPHPSAKGGAVGMGAMVTNGGRVGAGGMGSTVPGGGGAYFSNATQRRASAGVAPESDQQQQPQQQYPHHSYSHHQYPNRQVPYEPYLGGGGEGVEDDAGFGVDGSTTEDVEPTLKVPPGYVYDEFGCLVSQLPTPEEVEQQRYLQWQQEQIQYQQHQYMTMVYEQQLAAWYAAQHYRTQQLHQQQQLLQQQQQQQQQLLQQEQQQQQRSPVSSASSHPPHPRSAWNGGPASSSATSSSHSPSRHQTFLRPMENSPPHSKPGNAYSVPARMNPLQSSYPTSSSPTYHHNHQSTSFLHHYYNHQSHQPVVLGDFVAPTDPSSAHHLFQRTTNELSETSSNNNNFTGEMIDGPRRKFAKSSIRRHRRQYPSQYLSARNEGNRNEEGHNNNNNNSNNDNAAAASQSNTGPNEVSADRAGGAGVLPLPAPTSWPSIGIEPTSFNRTTAVMTELSDLHISEGLPFPDQSSSSSFKVSPPGSSPTSSKMHSDDDSHSKADTAGETPSSRRVSDSGCSSRGGEMKTLSAGESDLSEEEHHDHQDSNAPEQQQHDGHQQSPSMLAPFPHHHHHHHHHRHQHHHYSQRPYWKQQTSLANSNDGAGGVANTSTPSSSSSSPEDRLQFSSTTENPSSYPRRPFHSSSSYRNGAPSRFYQPGGFRYKGASEALQPEGRPLTSLTKKAAALNAKAPGTVAPPAIDSQKEFPTLQAH